MVKGNMSCYGTAAGFRRTMVISSARPSHLSQLLRSSPVPQTLVKLAPKHKAEEP